MINEDHWSMTDIGHLRSVSKSLSEIIVQWRNAHGIEETIAGQLQFSVKVLLHRGNLRLQVVDHQLQRSNFLVDVAIHRRDRRRTRQERIRLRT